MATRSNANKGVTGRNSNVPPPLETHKIIHKLYVEFLEWLMVSNKN